MHKFSLYTGSILFEELIVQNVVPLNDGQKVYDLPANLKTGPWDAIVIGSGMGGMCCAAALSKVGKKVLVLEQHYLPGGYTHMFTRKGFVWDVGVHAIGELDGKGPLAKMFRWLCEDQVKWQTLGADYDSFYFKDEAKIAFPNSKAEYIRRLKQMFPDEVQKIDKYFEYVAKARKNAEIYFALKSFPEWFDRIGSKILDTFRTNWWNVTTEEVLAELEISEKLKTVLTAQWGYHGNTPDHASFAINALVVEHFADGAYYPVGGSKSLAESLLGIVKRNGGQTVCRVSVDKILTENNKAYGVRLKNGTEVFAPLVISAAGARTTVTKLLPGEHQSQDWARQISKLKDSPSYISLYLGFEGDIEKAGASATNRWFFSTWARDEETWNVADKDCRPPILYVSFPSLKDPEHIPGEHRKHTGEVVTFVPWELFQQWKDTDPKKRPEEYLALKQEITERVLKELRSHMPELMEMLTYFELGTPLTSEHFVAASQGAIYGLDSSPERFACKKLRTRTPIKGFYMTGVDVTATGVGGGITSGLLTAASINPRIYTKMI